MLSVPLGWEIGNVKNGGANLVMPINREITVLGYQIDISLGFTALGSGFSEVLCTGVLTTATPVFAPGSKQQYSDGPFAANNDFAESSFDNPNNFLVGGGAGGWSGALFGAILKTNAPTSTSRAICMSGLSLGVPAGSFLVLHMDAAGMPGDVEMQGVIFYE